MSKSANAVFDDLRDCDLNVGGQLDAGNRLRVSQQTTQLDIKQINDNAPLFLNRENIGGATQVYDQSLGGSTMAVSSNSDAAICQSKMFASYFSGKSQLIEVTFSGMTHDTNVIKRAGYFSASTITPFDADKDGIWFESSGNDYRFIIEKSGTEILNISRSQWDDSLDRADLSKFNVLVIQFLYLGGTAVRFGFILDGVINWAHTYVHSGIVASTFITSPNQPIRYEVRSTGGSGSMDQICTQVSSEGSLDNVGVHRHVSNGAFTAPSAGTEYALLGIRLKSDYRNIRNDIRDNSLLAATNDDFKWRLLLNPTIAGTFTYNDIVNCSLQLALGANTNTISDDGDLVIAEGFGEGNSSKESPLESAIRIGSQIDGTQDEMVLTVEPFSNNLTFYSTIGLQEYA